MANLYRRKSSILRKAVCNVVLTELFNKHYNEIVFLERIDGDAFSETYLHLTVSYEADKPFVEQFKHRFNTLRLSYRLDAKEEKSQIVFTDAIFEKASMPES